MEEKLQELKQWCIDNADEQDGQDNDSGFYESMEFLKLEDVIEQIDKLLK